MVSGDEGQARLRAGEAGAPGAREQGGADRGGRALDGTPTGRRKMSASI